MARIKDIAKYEVSDFKPAWIDQQFPSDDEYTSIKEIIKFYLINSPCFRSSSRGTDITVWGKPNIILWNKLKKELNIENGKNFDYEKSFSGMKKLFDKYGLKKDFRDIKHDEIIFLLTDNIVESVFKHIRNSIAHSRWQKDGDFYYFEDGSDEVFDNVTYFCVSARIVLSEDSLIKWRNIILNGPSEEERQLIDIDNTLEDCFKRLRAQFGGDYFTRKEAVDMLGIDNNIWIKLYMKGKADKIMKFEKKHWMIKK